MTRLTTLKPRVQALDTRRVTKMAATERIRGRKLQRIRDRVLRADPLCAECRRQGRLRAAVHVDHIVALENGGTEDEFDDSNRQGLCEDCHEAKTKRDNAIARGETPCE